MPDPTAYAMVTRMVTRSALVPLLLLLFSGCKSTPSGADYTTPEATLKTLLHSVRTRDIALYKSCFTPEALRHGRTGLARYEKSPEVFWERTAAMLKGPITAEKVHLEETMAMLEIRAPNSSDPDLKAMDLRRSNGEWKIRRW